jgi:hypothetical protein
MSRTERGTERWPVDLDATMRALIAPSELPTLCDPKRYKGMLDYYAKTTRGYLGGGQPSVHITKKGLTQTTRIGPHLVPLMHGGKQVGQTTDQDVHLFTWKQVLDRCAQMDEAAVAALKESNAANLTHMASYKNFGHYCPKEAVGCGPVWRTPEDERTPAQKLYAEAHEKWVDEVDEPHRATSKVLRAEQRRLFEACFTTSWYDAYDTEDLVLDLDLG